ncbi:MAG: hypothetical protein CVV14_02930 [Gammaproteobacteria bacterium HGW-Gammaproteobacteria-4]|nr:MAG: hypothetical protein CVV14_02930 [Gammaproteobacteria bacterium HGW-Gammaproteobacteria-4]
MARLGPCIVAQRGSDGFGVASTRICDNGGVAIFGAPQMILMSNGDAVSRAVVGADDICPREVCSQ